jgi:ketosteroid isomerase-like protein
MSQENVEIVRGVRYRVSIPSARSAERRTLYERLFARFPTLYRLLAARLMRLPPHSRLRRLFLARLGGRGAAAFNRRDFDVLLYALDLGIEYRPRSDWLALDLDEVFYGHDGYRQIWRTMLDAFDDLRLEPEEVLDLGDRVLLTTDMSGHGTGSGVPVGLQQFSLFKFRDGMAVRQEDFNDRAKALEAAGLRE